MSTYTPTIMPTETVAVPDFSVANAPEVSIQATNLDGTQTVDLSIYAALGTESLALTSISDLTSIGPGVARVVQVNTRNLSRLEVRGTSTGAAQVRLVVV